MRPKDRLASKLLDFHQAIARVADHDIDPAKRGPGAIDYATGDEPIEDVRETLDF